jgi:hypothetical protein
VAEGVEVTGESGSQPDLPSRVAELARRAVEQQQRGDFPENWFPTATGESIGGEFLRYAEARTRDGDPATVAHIRTPEGERSVWLTHAVLRDQLSDLRPGEVVYIRYNGKRTSGKGFDYHDYTVEREGPGVA